MSLTQDQLDILGKNLKHKHIKIELLNEDFQALDVLEGVAIGGQIQMDSNNDIRYSGSITLAIPPARAGNNFLEKNDGYTISAGGKIWLDKRVRIYVGETNIKTHKIVWNNFGIFYIDQPVRNVSGTEYYITFQCSDQMIKLSGARQGYLTSLTTVFPMGQYNDNTPFIPQVGDDLSGTTLNFDTSYSGALNDFIQGDVIRTSEGHHIYFNLIKLWVTYGGLGDVNLPFLRNVVFGGEKIVAICNSGGNNPTTNKVYYATPAIVTSFTETTSTIPFPVGDITYNSKGFIIIPARDGGSYSHFLFSTDGVTWEVKDISQNCIWISVSSNDNYFVAFGKDSTGTYILAWSNDGVSWNTQKFSTLIELNSIAIADNDTFIIVGNSNKYIYGTFESSNKINFSTITFPIENKQYLFYCSYGTGIFMCLDQISNIQLISYEGSTWSYSQNTLDYHFDRLWCNGPEFCVSYDIESEGIIKSGVASYSSITNSWTAFIEENKDTDGNSWCVVFVGSQFIAVSTLKTLSSQHISSGLCYDDVKPVMASSNRTLGEPINNWFNSSTYTVPLSGVIEYINPILFEKLQKFTTFTKTGYTKTLTEEALTTVIRDIAGIEKFSIYPIPEKYRYLPYDIKIEVGSTILDILKKFKEILPTWQMYFDKDSGYFIVEPIPSGEMDITYPFKENQIISNQQNFDFQNVKNQVIVYGRLNQLDYFTSNTENENNVLYDTFTGTLNLHYDSLDVNNLVPNATLLGFKTPKQYNPVLKNINVYNQNTLLFTAPLVAFENSQSFIDKDFLEPEEIYAVRIYYSDVNNSSKTIIINSNIVCELFSKQQVAWTLVDDNIESPFYVNRNLPEPNYYAGFSKSIDGGIYDLTLNMTNTTSSIKDGTIITFIANKTNIENCGVRLYYNEIKIPVGNEFWGPKTWNGFTNINGSGIWTDGANIYYSKGSTQYVLNKDTNTWVEKTWNTTMVGETLEFDGADIWTDGDNIYYSSSYTTSQYVLNKTTNIWQPTGWEGLQFPSGKRIWTDGANIYYSNGSTQYALNKGTSTWVEKTWNGFTNIDGSGIWTDGDNIYCSKFGQGSYRLNKGTNTWVKKTWNILSAISGSGIWTDGDNIYYSYGSTQYALNKGTNTWVKKTWEGLTSFDGQNVWTDGINIYYSNKNVLIYSNIPIKQNVWNEEGTERPDIIAGKIPADFSVLKLKYDADNNYFIFLGKNEKVIPQVFSGGEFDNIYSDTLAYERCKLELYNHSNTQNSINITTVPNYTLDVNKKIPYKENVDDDSNPKDYIIKNISFSLGVDGTQTISAARIYDSGNLLGDDYKYKKSNNT